MYRKLIFILILTLAACSTGRKIAEPTYQYFIIDSVYRGNIYSMTIKDPDPVVEFVFPTGLADYPRQYDHYIKLYYKNDTANWAKNDTLILVKKSPKQE